MGTNALATHFGATTHEVRRWRHHLGLVQLRP